MTRDADPTAALGVEELRGRAVAGAALLGARGALIYAVGIGANLVLARLLVPRDFGVVALGTVLVVVGAFLVDSGFAAALIRREEQPTRRELAAVNAAQLLVAGGLAAAVGAVAASFGHDGLVVAAMGVSLPIIVLRTPSVVVLERALEYRLIATADVVEGMAYYAWSVGTVAAGFGVWGLATAVVVRAIVGSGIVMAAGPLGPVRPRWSWTLVRPLIGFGAKFQASVVLLIGREQGLNLAVAAVGGVATLGVWNLAWRMLQIPNLLFLTAGRVAFPAISRLLGVGDDPREALERGAAVMATLGAAVVVGLIGFAPALLTIVGHHWQDVPAVLLWAGVAVIATAPVTVAATSYLLAAGAAGTVATATLASSVVWFGVALPLLPTLGPPAIGIGWLAGGIVGGALLWRRTAARTAAAFGARLAPLTLVALAAAATGWFAAGRGHDTMIGGALGLAAGELVLAAGLVTLARPAARDTWTLVARGLRGFRKRRRLVGAQL